MLIGLNQVRGCDIAAKDGSIGKAHDFYFDDYVWTVRYLVIDTGWLFGRKVLVAPESIGTVDVPRAEISMLLTKKQIEDGPGRGTDLPVSRQQEMALREYYDWPEYWETYPAGTAAAPLVPPVRPREPEETAAGTSPGTEARERGDPHLRSIREVKGYDIEAEDGEIGHVDDFLVEDDTWTVRYIVVDTRNWLPGRKVLVAPHWAEGIDWVEGRVRLGLDREGVEHSPPYDPGDEITRDYERTLHRYFDREPYWT